MRGGCWIKNIEFKSGFGSQEETIGKNSEAYLKEMRIKKVCCVIVDNISDNNVSLAYLIRRVSDIRKNISMKYIGKKPISLVRFYCWKTPKTEATRTNWEFFSSHIGFTKNWFKPI
jgi:hypothetical protein